MNESVTKQQELVRNEDVELAPYRDIARLATLRNTGPKHGSGVFVNDRYILTAAHNVADITLFGLGSKIKEATVALGYIDGQEPFWSSQVLGRESSKWSSAYRPQLRRFGRFPFSMDYAVMDLGESLPNHSSSFRLPNEGEVKDLLSDGATLNLAGFPGELYSGRQMMVGRTNDVRVKRNSSFILYPELVTYTGNSGGPAWLEINGENILAGVHVTGSSAVILDGKVLRDVSNWSSEV